MSLNAKADIVRAEPLTAIPSLVVVSDRIDWRDPAREQHVAVGAQPPWRSARGERPDVRGGYLERLPLACIAASIVERAEIWHHQHGGRTAPFAVADLRLGYRAFPLRDTAPPFDNRAMVDFVRAFGAPQILVVYGLGISRPLLDACANSIIVYNSIDAPTLRVPPEVSARFDLILTAAEWQSEEVAALHPDTPTAVMPVGPEFQAVDQFRPLALPKDYDCIYVAAAQAYKRHDIMLDAFERLPRDVRGLCVFGYGEDADALRRRIAERGLNIDCVGPPGVPFDEVNRLMNRARIGLVCGRDDGAPAILTEYMLAGLPVLANAELACGTQYILPTTGRLARPGDFADAILAMRAEEAAFDPRAEVLARWTWPHTLKRLQPMLQDTAARKSFANFDKG